MASFRQFVGIRDYRYCAVKLPLRQYGFLGGKRAQALEKKIAFTEAA
jgi:hypothetical protein